MPDRSPDLALPRGFRDILPTEARELHAIERALMTTFSTFGYVPLEPPAVELAASAVTLDERRMLRFLDRDGRLLALRPDVTTAIARVVAQRYGEERRALRLSYFTPVFREEPSMRGSEREYDQAGVELIGASGPLADAEIVAVLAAALEACGLRDADIDIGHAGLLASFLDDLPTDERERALSHARSGDLVETLRLARSDRLEAALRHRADTLPSTDGLPAGAARAVDELARLRPLFDAAGVRARIRFDLGYVPSLPYYTGIVFQVTAPSLGFPIAAGGRYDALLGRFGTPRPATGFAIAVPHLHQAMVQAGWSLADEPPLVIVEPTGDDAATLRAATALRAQGRSVVIGEPADTAGQPVERAPH